MIFGTYYNLSNWLPEMNNKMSRVIIKRPCLKNPNKPKYLPGTTSLSFTTQKDSAANIFSKYPSLVFVEIYEF